MVRIMVKCKTPLIVSVFLLVCFITSPSQVTVYNNFGPEHEGWDYNYGLGWTVAGENVPQQYGVEQAMGFPSLENGVVCDIWIAFFYAPMSTMPDTVTVMLAHNPSGAPPEPQDVMEEWVLTDFNDWYQWYPPHHLTGNGSSVLQRGESYWLWAVAGEETWTGWCMNIEPALTCQHTMRREGEDWLPIANETASAFRVDVSTTGVSPFEVSLNPSGFELLQNYPNPFNSETTIRFKMVEPGSAKLTVYDIGGREIAVLLDQELENNTYEVVFNADGLPTGIYFYELAVNDFHGVGKMVMIK